MNLVALGPKGREDIVTLSEDREVDFVFMH